MTEETTGKTQPEEAATDATTPIEAADGGPEASTSEDERPSGPLDVNLPVYHGPLDLLLDLVRKHKLDVFDLPIARITEQYLAYLKTAEKLSIDLGGDFVFMASTLIHIKSKMLLPKDPTVPEEEQEDPRNELVRQLLDHEKFVQAAQMLRQKREVEENVWSNPPVDAFADDGDDEPGLAVSVFDLVNTFEKVLTRFKSRPTYEVSEEEVSVASRIEFLKNVLVSVDEPIKLEEVFEKQPGVRALVATFLAVLEMVRMQAILLTQDQIFGSIVVRKHKMFDTVFSGDMPISAADAEYSD